MGNEELVTVAIPEEVRRQLRMELLKEKAKLIRRIELIEKAIDGMALPGSKEAIGEGAKLSDG